jgi:TatD DNase family protein
LEEEKSLICLDISLFSGTYEQALQAISYNMKLGIGGVVTFKMERSILNQIDLKHIVLETDSPYLPIPFEGKEMKVVTWLNVDVGPDLRISANDI